MGIMQRFTKKEDKKKLAAGSQVKSAKTTDSNKNSVTPVATVKGTAYGIIIKPLVTEKSAVMQSANKFVFTVALNASKLQIKQAVKELYGVQALSVNLINVQGRRVRFGKSSGRRGDFKKAIVTLPKGQSIAMHEGV